MSYVGVYECVLSPGGDTRWRINVSLKDGQEAICPTFASKYIAKVFGGPNYTCYVDI